MKIYFMLGRCAVVCILLMNSVDAQETGYAPFGQGTCFKDNIPTPAPTQAGLLATLPQCIGHKLVVTGPGGGPITVTIPVQLCNLTRTTDIGLSPSYQEILSASVSSIRVCVVGVSSVSESGSSINMRIGFSTSGGCAVITDIWSVIPASSIIASQTLLFTQSFGDQSALNPWFTIPAGGSLCALYRDNALLGSGISKASVIVRYVDP